tara:strand:+ start:1123 stop:2004 length:882 start_codon:yes stop_codon:yes gene_type:complete
MKLTNIYGLPAALERFEEKNSYSKGDADYSVTQLIDSPQISKLKQVHDDEISEDISDRVLSLLGTATHVVLEAGAGPEDIVEKRFYQLVDGCRISGAVDLLTPSGVDPTSGEISYSLRDYKTVSGTAMAINPKGKSEWIKQLNIYSWLATLNGYKISDIGVVAIVRDWRRSLVRRNANFPKQGVVNVPLPLWPHEQQRQFIEKCVAEHNAETPRECSNEERWMGKNQFAVHEYRVDGGLKKNATRLFGSATDAEGFILEKGKTAEVVCREGTPTRCIDNYCRVAQFCDQFKNE